MNVGKVESLWRYPVKSMRGEELENAFVGFSGIYGDRIFAFKSSASSPGFPFFTAREQEMMLRYRPRFRNPAASAQPPNLPAAADIGPGVTPIYGDHAELAVDVEDPTGKTFAIDDPRLLDLLLDGAREGHQLSLLRSERALTDCRPVSLFSMQTVRQLENEIGVPMDYRRFRASIYVDLSSGTGFGEDTLVGRSVRIGSKVVVAVLQRDSRCKMITLDPETGEANPEVMRKLSSDHEGKAGVYGAVLVEGIINKGDPIELLS
jgi:uncharacterized protein YcbX